MKHAAWLGWLSVLAAASLPAGAQEARSVPVLLVHGMAWNPQADDSTWGELATDDRGPPAWTGMVGYLVSRGYSYGGAIRAPGGQVELPQDLDTQGVLGPPAQADLFVLKFSRHANVDGLAHKALELAQAVEQLRRLTGAPRVRLVTHSAGGVVARVYLQNALPGVTYRHDIERLVTIATPHLGSVLAEHFGDFLGTRATSLKPNAPLMVDLNRRFDLPEDVMFASIIIRGLGVDVDGDGEPYGGVSDPSVVTALPAEYLEGGDEVVHVRSQNLRLAECSTRYEQRTGRPVHHFVVRVADPNPDDWWSKAELVHVEATSDANVHRLVANLMADDAAIWNQDAGCRLAPWMEWQAQVHMCGQIEAEARRQHWMSNVRVIELKTFQASTVAGGTSRYEFEGRAWSKNGWIPCRRRWTDVRGNLELAFDEFGRVRTAAAR